MEGFVSELTRRNSLANWHCHVRGLQCYRHETLTREVQTHLKYLSAGRSSWEDVVYENNGNDDIFDTAPLRILQIQAVMGNHENHEM